MMSKGEKKIANILSAANIKYKQEYSFKGLYGINANHLLRFDFVLFDRNNNIIACIDYDGAQHFQFTPFFHKSQIDFRRQKEYDMRKNKYCLSHRIPLIRIPYWVLDDLTFDKIFTTQDFIVRTPNHNLNLIKQR